MACRGQISRAAHLRQRRPRLRHEPAESSLRCMGWTLQDLARQSGPLVSRLSKPAPITAAAERALLQPDYLVWKNRNALSAQERDRALTCLSDLVNRSAYEFCATSCPVTAVGSERLSSS